MNSEKNSNKPLAEARDLRRGSQHGRILASYANRTSPSDDNVDTVIAAFPVIRDDLAAE